MPGVDAQIVNQNQKTEECNVQRVHISRNKALTMEINCQLDEITLFKVIRNNDSVSPVKGILRGWGMAGWAADLETNRKVCLLWDKRCDFKSVNNGMLTWK